jgi:hypothetical protein
MFCHPINYGPKQGFDRADTPTCTTKDASEEEAQPCASTNLTAGTSRVEILLCINLA